MRRVRGLLAWGALLFCAVPSVVFATGQGTERPAVVVLKIAEDEAGAVSEEAFVSELRLALDRFRVIAVEDPSRGFSDSAFTQRLDLIRELSDTYNAVATIWVERWDADKMLLNLTAMSTGRALLKIVEVKSGPSAESELAFAAATLLGEAYLFAPEGQGEAVRQSVERVRETILDSNEAVRPGGASLTLGALLFGPLYPVAYGAPCAGGGVSWMYEGRRGWFVSPGLSAFAGPTSRTEDGVISGFGLQGEVLAGIHFRVKRWSLGPALGAGIRYQRFDGRFGADGDVSRSLVGFRGSLAADIQVALSRTAALTLRLDAAITPNRLEFKRVSNEAILLSTPLVEGGAWVGFRYFFR